MGVDNQTNSQQLINNDLDISVDLSNATNESAFAEGQRAGSHDAQKGYTYAAGLYLKNVGEISDNIQIAFFDGYQQGYADNLPLDDTDTLSDWVEVPKGATNSDFGSLLSFKAEATNPNPINHRRNALIAFTVIFAVLAAAAIAGGIFAAIAMTGGVAAVPAGLVLFSVSGFAVGLKAAMIAAFSAAAVTVATTIGLSVGAHQSTKAVLYECVDSFDPRVSTGGTGIPAPENSVYVIQWSEDQRGRASSGSEVTVGTDDFSRINGVSGTSDGERPATIGLDRN